MLNVPPFSRTSTLRDKASSAVTHWCVEASEDIVDFHWLPAFIMRYLQGASDFALIYTQCQTWNMDTVIVAVLWHELFHLRGLVNLSSNSLQSPKKHYHHSFHALRVHYGSWHCVSGKWWFHYLCFVRDSCIFASQECLDRFPLSPSFIPLRGSLCFPHLIQGAHGLKTVLWRKSLYLCNPDKFIDRATNIDKECKQNIFLRLLIC